MTTIATKYPFVGAVETRTGGRAENQDNAGFVDTPLGLLLVVCDGMGGGPGGRTASLTAVDTILSLLEQVAEHTSRQDALTYAIEKANDAVYGLALENPELRGMGTTVAAMIINEDSAVIAHVGDSRIYQLRKGTIIFRSADHSVVANLVRQKRLTEEEARNHPQSNVITRALGIRPEVEAELDEVVFQRGDRFVLCSDGIWGAMPQAELILKLSQPMGIGELADTVAAEVDQIGINAGGGHDNLTLALVDAQGDSTVKRVKAQPQPSVMTDKRTPVSPPPAASASPAASAPEVAAPAVAKPAAATGSRRKWLMALSLFLLSAAVVSALWFLWLKDSNRPATPPPAGERHAHEPADNASVAEVSNPMTASHGTADDDASVSSADDDYSVGSMPYVDIDPVPESPGANNTEQLAPRPAPRNDVSTNGGNVLQPHTGGDILKIGSEAAIREQVKRHLESINLHLDMLKTARKSGRRTANAMRRDQAYYINQDLKRVDSIGGNSSVVPFSKVREFINHENNYMTRPANSPLSPQQINKINELKNIIRENLN